MRTTIRLNDELARRVKERAKQNGRSFTQFVETALVESLAKPSEKKRNKKVVLPTLGDPRKKITREEYAAMIEQMQLSDDLRTLGFSE